ncbi:uncharacterized protein LOC117643343 [Thrips palmi]|uniref:Uncharacterized protein LOC117643343 n=1 Tax=Thrips palmi TaxID=161013 RepID=A0A6P8YLT9_THRPL|nr:uncharacterized protein LOC117643343 [Thrips palmi]
MPLIMVANEERKIKVLLAASTTQQLNDKAVKKLKLSQDMQYKVCVDSSGAAAGSEIDEDDLLLELSSFYSKSNAHLEVVMLPSHKDWSPPESVEGLSRRSNSDSSCNSNSDSDSSGDGPCADILEVSLVVPPSPCVTKPSSHPSIPITPFNEIFEPVLEAMRRQPPPCDLVRRRKAALMAAQKEVASHILKKVKDFRKEVCERYATAVFSSQNGKFKPVFEKRVNDHFCSDGLADFICHIYNAVNYSKGSENTSRRGQRRKVAALQEEVDNPDEMEPQAKARSIDDCSYGCENFNPPLPSDETLETQEQKREHLAQSKDLSSAYAVSLFQKTYSSQRSEIVGCKTLPKLTDVFVRWPCLKSANLLIHHASILFNKDVKNLWAMQLDKMTPDLTGFFKSYCRKSPRSTATAELLKVFSEAQGAVETMESQIPNTFSVFFMIIAYMREKHDFFFQVAKDCDSDSELLEHAACSNGNPILLVQGFSVFDPMAKCFVVVLKNHVIEVRDQLEGILVMFISFFIFGFKYTEEVQNTLEFIQRFFFLINPPSGDKRVVARRKGHLAGKVYKLSEEIRAYSSPWSIPSV